MHVSIDVDDARLVHIFIIYAINLLGIEKDLLARSHKSLLSNNFVYTIGFCLESKSKQKLRSHINVTQICRNVSFSLCPYHLVHNVTHLD